MSLLHTVKGVCEEVMDMTDALVLRRSSSRLVQGPKEIGDVDTDDDKDEEAQYEQWKIREMARIR